MIKHWPHLPPPPSKICLEPPLPVSDICFHLTLQMPSKQIHKMSNSSSSSLSLVSGIPDIVQLTSTLSTDTFTCFPVVHLLLCASPCCHLHSDILLSLRCCRQRREDGLTDNLLHFESPLSCSASILPLKTSRQGCQGESYLCNQHFTTPIRCKSDPSPLNHPISLTSLSASLAPAWRKQT